MRSSMRMTHFSNKGREIAQNANDATLKKICYPIPVFYECYCFSSCQKHTMFIHNKPALSVTVIYLPPVFPQQLLQCQRALRVAAAVMYLIFRIVMNESNGSKMNRVTESKKRIGETYLRCHSRHVLCKIIPLICLMPICIFDMFYHKSM